MSSLSSDQACVVSRFTCAAWGYGTGPRAAIEVAAPCGGAATSITWGLRLALLRRWRSAGRGCRPDPGWRPCSQRRTCGDPPAASARAAPAAPPHQADVDEVGRRPLAASLGKMPTTLVRRLKGGLAKRTSRCDIDPLQQVGAVKLFPVLLGEGSERQHVLPSLMHERGGLGEAIHQGGGQVIPAAEEFAGGLLGENAAQGSGDYALVSLGDTLQQVAGKVYSAALPDAALQLAADRLGEPAVGV